jgi:hypothetical protein
MTGTGGYCRLWIAAGNEALAYTQATGQPVHADRTWANLYDLRNHLAHSRLPDIDESLVRRFTWTRSTPSRAPPSTTWHFRGGPTGQATVSPYRIAARSGTTIWD